MRISVIVMLGALLGCYRSHERLPLDAGEESGGDARLVRDAPDASAPPDCIVSCGAVEHVAVFDVPPGEVMSLSAAAVSGNTLGVLMQASGGDFVAYSLASVDLDTGRVSGPPRAQPILTHNALTVRALEARPDGLVVTALTATAYANRTPTSATLEVASFDSDGSLLAPASVLGDLPLVYSPCECPLRGAIFGRRRSEAVAQVQGADVWLSHLEIDAPSGIRDSSVIFRFDEAPPRTTPVSADMLPDGRAVIAGGGFGIGLAPRDAFLLIEQVDDVPRSVSLPGERFDPSPAVVASDAGIAVFRYISNPRDLDDGRLRAELRDDRGEIIDALDVRPTHGLVPVGSTTFAGARTAGLVWVEPDSGLRVLPEAGSGSAATWAECERTATPAVTTLADGLELAFTLESGGSGSAILALGPGDSADELLVVVFLAAPDDSRERVEVLRIPGCRLDRSR